tara:strand:- start:203 stop:697 length:495 start_codon:yes stop_codon:yes gene_type:complete
MASLVDDYDNNFLNSIRTRDLCSSVSCPENYIPEQTGFARCNSSPCNVALPDGEDLNICCIPTCNSDSDCNKQICVTENDVSICTNSCNDDSDCEDELSCLEKDGKKYCQKDESKFISLLNRFGFIIERALYSDNIIVDTVILIIFAYLISKFIDTFNININIT